MTVADPPVPLDALADSLFTVARGGETQVLSLARLLATLLADPKEVDSFPNLTAEQRGHWNRLLVRCAAKALHEARLSTAQARQRGVDAIAAEIAEVLQETTPASTWLLHQPNPSQPGFLQIRTPDGELPGAGNNYKSNSVSLLTSTIGGKNHERKADLARELTPEQTAYALVEYQFSAIYAGRFNYETQLLGSRSGAGSGVPFMGPRIGDSRAESFRHDVQVLLDRWDAVAAELQGSVWALWAERWDGKSQLGSERLDPAFIPVARMIRLAAPEDGVFRTVWFRPTDTGRVRDHTNGGVLGDPLVPLVPDPKTGDPKVRGTLRKGYDYTEVVRLLFGTDEQGGTPSASVQALADRGELDRGDLRVLFEGTAYEQGKTGGYHRREVLLPTSGGRDVIPWINDDSPTNPVRRAHTAMYDAVRDAKSALRGAARILLNGEPRRREGDDAKVNPVADQLEQVVDAAYLEHLFTAAGALDAGRDDWLTKWLRWLSKEAEKVFRASLGMLPTSTGRRWERETSAESYLGYKLRKLRGEVGEVGGTQEEEEAEEQETLDDEPEPEEEI